MRKILPIILISLILTSASAQALELFGWFKKDKETQEQPVSQGYQGNLPNVEKEFDHLRNIPSPPSGGKTYDNDFDETKLKKIPSKNSKYVEIMLEHHIENEYLLDAREMISLLEKMKKNINSTQSLQFFNAQTASLINNANYFHDKYRNKKEAKRPEYKRLIALSNSAREVAITYAQSEIYKQYIPTSETKYAKESISREMKALLPQIEELIIMFKEAE